MKATLFVFKWYNAQEGPKDYDFPFKPGDLMVRVNGQGKEPGSLIVKRLRDGRRDMVWPEEVVRLGRLD